MKNEDIILMRASHKIKKILYAYSDGKLKSIRHFMSKKLYDKLSSQLENDKNNKQKVCIDEINVELKFNRSFTKDNYDYIEALCYYKLLKYTTSSGKVIDGDSENRVAYSSNVILKKHVNADERTYIECLGCGKSFDLMSTNKCPKCGRVYELEIYDYVIDEMEI